MNLLPEFPSVTHIFSLVVALIVVNAITAAIAIWALNDIRDHRAVHRTEINRLTEAMKKCPSIDSAPKKGMWEASYSEYLPPVILGGLTFKFDDSVWYEGFAAVVTSDPAKSDAGKVQIEYLPPGEFDTKTIVVGSGSLSRRIGRAHIDRLIAQRPRPLNE